MTTALSRNREHYYYVRFSCLEVSNGLRPTKGSMGNECAHSGIILAPGMKIIQAKYKSVTMTQDCLALSASIRLCGNVEGKDEATSQVTLRPLLRSSQGSTQPVMQ